MLTGPMLYAKSQNHHCEGYHECFWCSSPTTTFLTLPPEFRPAPFVRKAEYSLRPGSKFICIGCWLFRRNRVTIPFLSGGFIDSRCPVNYSWWISGQEASAIRDGNKEDYEALYDRLLNPPRQFLLSIVTDTLGIPKQNRLQYAVVNDVQGEIDGETVFHFTIDHLKLTYTTYELEQALKNLHPEGVSPGVRALLDLLGAYKPKSKIEMMTATVEKPQPKGRPKNEDKKNEKSFNRVVRMSGK